MPPNLLKIGEAVANGLSAVCATCDLYWAPRSRGVVGGQCDASSGCCSPLGGGDFHEYSGPISDLGRWCFVCGNNATKAARAAGHTRAIGVCEDHIKLFSKLRPTDEIDQVRADLVGGREVIPVHRVVNRKKTLVETMREADAYMTEQAAKKS